MKFKRLSFVFILALVLNTIFSSFAFADNTDKKNLVALGDSITFGWNLEKATDPNNLQPHSEAFPYLIGDGDYTVTKNISGGGWKTTDLIAQLSDPANLAAIQNANLITLDIGNNDLLQTPEIKTVLGTPTPTSDQIAAATAAAQVTAGNIAKNLTAIIGMIRHVNTNAPIILYNLYNPFGSNAPALHDLAEKIIPQINNQVIFPVAMNTGAHLADAYTAFSGKQADYILPGDIHPTILGHQVLAGLANDILDELKPLDIVLTPSTTDKTTGPVTITITTNAKETAQMKWLPGEKTEDDFTAEPGGNKITDNKFTVSENGKYTVFVMDSKERVALKVIDITNIVKNIPSTPGDTGKPVPVTTTSNPGHPLPETASSIYNELAVGLAVVLAGLAAFSLQKRRREN